MSKARETKDAALFLLRVPHDRLEAVPEAPPAGRARDGERALGAGSAQMEQEAEARARQKKEAAAAAKKAARAAARAAAAIRASPRPRASRSPWPAAKAKPAAPKAEGGPGAEEVGARSPPPGPQAAAQEEKVGKETRMATDSRGKSSSPTPAASAPSSRAS